LVPQDRQRAGRAAEVSASPAKKALAQIWGAEDKDHALAAVKAFDAAYGAEFPKATARITGDAGELLAFFDYPCEHRVHLRTTNPIESTSATVRHRTKVTKGPGSRAAGLAMASRSLLNVLFGSRPCGLTTEFMTVRPMALRNVAWRRPQRSESARRRLPVLA